MFKCPFCRRSIGPKVKPVTIISKLRDVSYTNVVTQIDEFERETKKVVNSTGTEIVTTAFSCPDCAGIPKEFPVQTQTTIRKGGNAHEEPMPVPMRPKLVALAVHNMLNRTDHKSKRAKAECAATIPVIKQFVNNNTKFVF